jgi:glycosyltransferase involved in cell wall biosynthesis
MRVLHVDTAATWRGGQNQVRLTALGQAAQGHEVAVAFRDGGALSERLRGTTLGLHAISFRGDLSPLAALSLARVLKTFRPHVMQLHDPHAITAGLMAVRLQPGARVIGVRRVDFPLRSPLSRRKYRGCHRVVAVSQAIAEILDRAGISPASVRVVYEGVPSRPAAVGGREALRRLGVPEGAPVIGNVAALAGHKDHATLLAALPGILQAVPEARLVIVGDGELRSALEIQATALGLGGRCLFAGFRTDVDALMPAFDLFCLSSSSEGLGTSLLDAMNFGRAVVATRAGGIPEAVEDGVTGLLVPVGDPSALARAAVDLLLDPARREAMGQAARSRFEERFTVERMVSATLHVYDECR